MSEAGVSELQSNEHSAVQSADAAVKAAQEARNQGSCTRLPCLVPSVHDMQDRPCVT